MMTDDFSTEEEELVRLSESTSIGTGDGMSSPDPSPVRKPKRRVRKIKGINGSMSAREPSVHSYRSDYSSGIVTERNPFRDCKPLRASLGARNRTQSNPAFGSIYAKSEAPGPGMYTPREPHTARKGVISIKGKARSGDDFIGRAQRKARETPGPGAHDHASAFGTQRGINKSKVSRAHGYRGGSSAPSYSFGSASTHRGAMERLPYGSSPVEVSPASPTMSGGGTPRTGRSQLARAGSSLARAMYISKEHARENVGAHSPGPAAYTTKSSFISTGAGVTAAPLRKAPSYQFGTSGRF